MIAKNNIFNIRAGRAEWQGMTGTRKGFVEFMDQEHAIRAWLVLMRNYRRQYHCDSIRKIVTRFAPPTENNTANYIQFCAKEVGTLADNRLERYTEYAMLAVAMAKMETSVKLTTRNWRTAASHEKELHLRCQERQADKQPTGQGYKR